MKNDAKTNLAGLIVSAAMGLNVDWQKLMSGDSVEVGKLVGAIAAAVWAYYTNKPDKTIPA